MKKAERRKENEGDAEPEEANLRRKSFNWRGKENGKTIHKQRKRRKRRL